MIFKRRDDSRLDRFMVRASRPAADPVPPQLPGFATYATDDLIEGLPREGMSKSQIRVALSDALGASHPVTQPAMFAGRRDALQQLIGAIEQQRAHVVIYGERGIGKTSLVHVFAEAARAARYLVLYGSCGVEATFDEMFRAFAARIPLLYHKEVSPTAGEAEHNESFEKLLPSDVFGPRELSDLFAQVVGTRIILILDEYDRVAEPSFRRDIAELIKNLSDRAARVQIVLTGVASNLDELIGFTPSIRRNIIGLGIGPMSMEEVGEVLATGEAASGMSFAQAARQAIEVMAAGSPYLARLIGSRASVVALDADRMDVTEADVRTAVESTLAEWNSGLPRRVQAMLARPEVGSAWPTLIAAARASGTHDGWFGPDDAAAELGGGATPEQLQRSLDAFLSPIDLFETDDDPQAGRRYRFRYQGVAQLLNLSAALARLQRNA